MIPGLVTTYVLICLICLELGATKAIIRRIGR